MKPQSTLTHEKTHTLVMLNFSGDRSVLFTRVNTAVYERNRGEVARGVDRVTALQLTIGIAVPWELGHDTRTMAYP